MNKKLLKARLTRYKNWPIKVFIFSGKKVLQDYGRRSVDENGAEEFELLKADETLQPPTTQDYFYGEDKHILFIYKKDFDDYDLITEVDTDQDSFSLDLKNRRKWAIRMANQVEKTLRPDDESWFNSKAAVWISAGVFLLLTILGNGWFVTKSLAEIRKLVAENIDKGSIILPFATMKIKSLFKR